MGFYDSEEGVTQYIALAEGYDGKDLIEHLRGFLKEGSSLLELGMGPGKDLDIMKEYYRVTGSDTSEIFLDRYRAEHPDADLLLLDAEKIDTDRSFDAVYSNKVLHHLSYDQMRNSFRRQADLLEAGGLIFHTFWYGDQIEEYDGLFFYQVTEERLSSLIDDRFEILELVRYTEMEEDDSLYVIAAFS